MSNTETPEVKTIAAPAVKTAAPKAAATKTVKAPKALKPIQAATAAPAKKPAAKKVVKAEASKPVPATKKPAVRTAPAKPKAAVTATAPKEPGKVKQKLVRDSFAMPRADFVLVNTLKERALGFRRPTKKSELLRAGLHALAALTDAKLQQVLDGLVPLKTGRPKKGE